MPSTFTKLPLESGTGSFQTDGHEDEIIHVIQRETNGLALNQQNERRNPISIAQALDAAGNPPDLDLDRTQVAQYGAAPSALRWTFYYSNDKFFNLGTLGDSSSGGTLLGTFDQTPETVQRAYPALLKTETTLLGGAFGITTKIPLYQRVELDNVAPEVVLKWKVKAVTTLWNANVAQDIAVRRGTMHVINGNLFEFNGVAGVRKRSATEYEVTYVWNLDPGTTYREIASDQPDSDNKLILPPVVASGDPALTTPGSAPDFAGDTFMRLPYHSVTLGQTDAATVQPPFIQFRTSSFDTSKYFDWQLLPGDPVNQV